MLFADGGIFTTVPARAIAEKFPQDVPKYSRKTFNNRTHNGAVYPGNALPLSFLVYANKVKSFRQIEVRIG